MPSGILPRANIAGAPLRSLDEGLIIAGVRAREGPGFRCIKGKGIARVMSGSTTAGLVAEAQIRKVALVSKVGITARPIEPPTDGYAT